jgi:hypothetical protein
MESMGIPVGEINYYKCYSLDSDTMREQEWVVDVDNNEIETGIQWTAKDNYYKFYARQSFQGLPIYYSDSELGISLNNVCMPIQVLIGENGICSLDLEKIYRFEEGEEPIILLETDEIIQNLCARYSDVLTSNQYTIYNSELMYYAKKVEDNSYTLLPVWVFEMWEQEKGAEAEDKHFEIVILDAQTGNEVSTE